MKKRNTYTVEAYCEEEGGEFELKGCFADGTAPTYMFFEDFQYYESDGTTPKKYFYDDIDWRRNWGKLENSLEIMENTFLEEYEAGNLGLKGAKNTQSHWGVGVYTKKTFNTGVKIKYRLNLATNYTNGTSHEGLFIYQGDVSSRQQHYGYPTAATNLGNISIYAYSGFRLYTGGIFGGSSYTSLPTNAGRIFDFTVYINEDNSWQVEVDYPSSPSTPTTTLTGNLNVNDLANYKMEFYSGDYGSRYSYFDNIQVDNTAIDCNLTGVDTSGYDVSSCPAGNFRYHACDITCDEVSGLYYQNGTPALSCPSENGPFTLSGCKRISTLEEYRSEAVLYLDAASGVSESGGNVTSWTSRENKNGNTYTLTSNNSANVTYSAANANGNNKPSITVNGSGYLSNTAYTEMNGLNEFTRIVVAKTDTTIHRGGLSFGITLLVTRLG